MILPLLLTAGLAAMQATPSPPVEVGTSRVGPGRFFVSPMGEPFYGRTAGEDGLLVWFEQADRNHDGALTADEMAADSDRFFAVLDRQHDGEIDPDDMNYYESVLAPQVRARAIVTRVDMTGGETTEKVDDETSSASFGLLAIPQPVASADRNFNRGVSPEEFRAAARRRFSLLDRAGTGRLTLAQAEDLRQTAAQQARKLSTYHNVTDEVREVGGGDRSSPQ